ncbi:MAG: RNA polymerase sigma factor, partial [Verrucomicrobiota bacterium]
ASQQGDHDAFASLVKRYQHMIYSLAYRMTGSHADAEDLAQETFIQAHSALASFRAESRFSSWLYRLAVNQCLNWKKRTHRRDEIHDQWSEQENSVANENESATAAVNEALLKLDAKQRAAIILTVYDGLNHAEAAHALGCSETTVSWRIFSARRKLKSYLSKTMKGVSP